jgi:hypothetical protein
MRGFNNPFAELKSLDKNWFYCWMTRILVERISHFIAAESIRRFGHSHLIKLIFSPRGGLSYSQTKAYVELLKTQSRGNSLFFASWKHLLGGSGSPAAQDHSKRGAWGITIGRHMRKRFLQGVRRI